MYSSWSVGAAVCSCVFPTLAIVAVGFRFRARQVRKITIGADDWLVLAALVFAVAYCFIVLYGSFRGSIGQKLSTVTADQYSKLQKILLADVIVSHLAYGFIKLGVLFFYKRIFSIPKFHLVANIICIVVTLFMIALILSQIFAAWPISNWWKMGKPFVINYGAALTAFSALDLALDVIILCLPVPIIRKMNMKRSKKLLVLGVFWMGFFCVIVTAVRVYFSYRLSKFETQRPTSDNEYSYVAVNNVIWAEIECCCSVIGGCLPTYAPFLRQISAPKPVAGAFRRVWKLAQRKMDQSTGSSRTDDMSNVWYPLWGNDRRIATVVDGGRGGNVQALNQLRGIRVERDFARDVESRTEGQKEPV